MINPIQAPGIIVPRLPIDLIPTETFSVNLSPIPPTLQNFIEQEAKKFYSVQTDLLQRKTISVEEFFRFTQGANLTSTLNSYIYNIQFQISDESIFSLAHKVPMADRGIILAKLPQGLAQHLAEQWRNNLQKEESKLSIDSEFGRYSISHNNQDYKFTRIT